MNCFVVLPEQEFQSRLHPGFSTIQANGETVVVAVIPGSPARQAGILPNDVIERVNGKRYDIAFCDAHQGWESSPGSRKTRLLIRRNGSERELTIRLVSVASLLSANWAVSRQDIFSKSVSLVSAARPKRITGTFIVGLRVAMIGDAPIVLAVLRGSPADRADIEPGDKILSANRTDAATMGTLNASLLTSGDHPYTIEVQVQRGVSVRHIRLESLGISEILRDLGAPRAPASRSLSNSRS